MFNKVLSPALFKKIRVKANLSREELATLMDCSVATIIKHETKECKMSLRDFEKLMMVTTTSKEDRDEREKLFKSFSDMLLKLIKIN